MITQWPGSGTREMLRYHNAADGDTVSERASQVGSKDHGNELQSPSWHHHNGAVSQLAVQRLQQQIVQFTP